MVINVIKEVQKQASKGLDFVTLSTKKQQKVGENMQQPNNSQINALVSLLDGYVEQGGHHLNVNVFSRETLLEAQQKPELYPQLTVRVSGYAVNFHKLTAEQQADVINRTFHQR